MKLIEVVYYDLKVIVERLKHLDSLDQWSIKLRVSHDLGVNNLDQSYLLKT